MPQQLTATILDASKKIKQQVGIMLPDSLYEVLVHKGYTIEIVDLEPNCHSIYICDKDTDVISVSFDPQRVDAVKIAFKTVNDKLMMME